jgi:hypothetical protein
VPSAVVVTRAAQSSMITRASRSGTARTILECRPVWPDLMGSEWTRAPLARLSYSKQAGEWTLYYADRNDRFHRYWECGPSAHVAELLAEIDADPTCIFWGDCVVASRSQTLALASSKVWIDPRRLAKDITECTATHRPIVPAFEVAIDRA